MRVLWPLPSSIIHLQTALNIEDVMENLWPDFRFYSATQPKELLQHQADFLGKITNTQLLASIHTTRNKQAICHKFLVMAPKADHLATTLFDVQESTATYPVSVTFDGRTFSEPDVENFKQLLAEIFRFPQTQQLIISMYLQCSNQQR